MTKTHLTEDLLQGLEEVKSLARDMRFGQMLATLEMLADDMFERTLWEIEDDQLLEVIKRFRADLTARTASVV